MINQQALTLTSNSGILRALASELTVCPPILNPTTPPTATRTCLGIWDTGATGSVITQRVVDDLQLKPTGMTQVKTAGGSHTSPVYLVTFILPNKVIISGLNVTLAKLEGADVLIGMDVITLGDFSITNLKGITKMSFRTPSCVEVDYVKEIDRQSRPNKKFTPSRKKRKR